MYKALHTIGKLQKRDEVGRANAMVAASVLGAMMKLNNTVTDPTSVVSHYRAVLDAMNDAVRDDHTRKDFSAIFEKYIHA